MQHLVFGEDRSNKCRKGEIIYIRILARTTITYQKSCGESKVGIDLKNGVCVSGIIQTEQI